MHEMNPELRHESLDHEALHKLYLRDIASTHGRFDENPYLALGDSDSGHGVMFGKLKPYGQVAIKPYETVGRARHELEVMDYASKLGLDTLEPLELSTQGRHVYLITRYRPDLRHLGQLDWNANVASRSLTRVIKPTLHFAADFAGQVHSLGITHGDYQPKNTARTREGGGVLADVENGQIRLKGNELVFKGNMDLIRFAVSVLRRGLLYDRRMSYRIKFLGDEFIVPALEAEGVGDVQTIKQRKLDVGAKVGAILFNQAVAKHPSVRARVAAIR
ncbi:MAG: hypothetical protein ACREF7_04530 [Candidatus Saccharimonadales bacterium]